MSGTWTSHCKNKENGFMKVSDKLEIIAAATLRTNPATGKSQVFSWFSYTIFCKLSICVPWTHKGSLFTLSLSDAERLYRIGWGWCGEVFTHQSYIFWWNQMASFKNRLFKMVQIAQLVQLLSKLGNWFCFTNFQYLFETYIFSRFQKLSTLDRST